MELNAMAQVFTEHKGTAVFFEQSPMKLFIGGDWSEPGDGSYFPAFDPGTGEKLAEISDASASDVDRAVDAAAKAFSGDWPKLPPNERSCLLHRFADLVESRTETIAEIESLDVGKPLAQARQDAQNFCQTMRYYADLAVHSHHRLPIAVPHHEASVVHLPVGVCGFIFPWNFPFLLLGWGIAPALAAGNTVIVKPAEDTSLSTLFAMQLVQEAGIPAGVVNIVTGRGETTGAALARNPKLARMSFTGSPEVGRRIARECGQNLIPVKLELGGKGAAVVFNDIDIDKTVDALVAAITLNAGQVCCTASRWVLQDSIYNRFVEAAVARLSQVRIGYGHDPETQMGPVVSEKQSDRVLGYLEKARREGADLILEGGAASIPGKPKGHYVKPALIAGKSSNTACREEIFGPVPYILKFKDEGDAIRLVNELTYGLANSVWSNDLSRAYRVAEQLHAGNSWINAHNVFVHGVPYGGTGLSGLGGGVLSEATYFDYLGNLSVVRPL
jgi:acyl-CoA reductase-like NAD-dependent aldehyde dehydrogenase